MNFAYQLLQSDFDAKININIIEACIGVGEGAGRGHQYPISLNGQIYKIPLNQ